METFLSLFVLLIMCGSIQLQTSDIEETIYTGGHPIRVLKDRGKSRRLEFKNTPCLKNGNLQNPPGTYPWEVSIGLVDQTARGHWTHYCGGVIASKNHVITSANCLDFMVESEYAGCSVTDIHIRVGDYHLKVENEMIRNVEIQEIKISNYKVHPEFNRTEYPEDIQHYKNIAVITLEESLNFEHISVRSIYLPSLEEAQQITKKSNTDVSLVLSGWGRWTSKNGIKHGPGEALRDGIIATFDDTYCESVYNETRLSEGFTDDIMCGANPLNLAGVCCGDDGTGVVKLDHERERFVLTGILSLGTEWNNEAEELSCGHKNKPNIFVRVASKSIITFLYESIYGIPVVSNQTEEVSAGLLEMEVSQYSYEECGLNTAIEDDYNYGDETNKTGVWPWLVSLRKELQDVNDYSYKWTHFCGGTILSPTRILTAAHCVYDFSGLDTVIKIRAGDALLNNNNDDGDIQEIVIQNFTVHLNYTHNLRYFDLAILELENPLVFSKYVRPVCLLSLEEAISISKSAEEYLPMCVAGWGNMGNELKHTVATVFSEETCNRTHPNKIDYRNLVPNLFTEDTMCAGDPAGESGTCRGDSGSGAVHFEQRRQRYVQRAVVSGSAHGLCGSMYYPNVYVRLSNPDILQWIFDEIGFFPPKPVAVSDEKLVHSDTIMLCTTSPAIPASAITWIVRDQNENLVDHEKLLETSTKTNEGFITSSYVKITTSKAVSVQCEAKNVAGKQTNNSINELGITTPSSSYPDYPRPRPPQPSSPPRRHTTPHSYPDYPRSTTTATPPRPTSLRTRRPRPPPPSSPPQQIQNPSQLPSPIARPLPPGISKKSLPAECNKLPKVGNGKMACNLKPYSMKCTPVCDRGHIFYQKFSSLPPKYVCSAHRIDWKISKFIPDCTPVSKTATGACRAGWELRENYCVACPPGMFRDLAAPLCQLCPKSSYTTEPGSGQCSMCPAGQTTRGLGNRHTNKCRHRNNKTAGRNGRNSKVGFM